MQNPKIIALEACVMPAQYEIKSDICAIGRSEMCQIIVQLPTVSRLHARIEHEGIRYVLYDADSANGSFVNGRRIYEPHPLKNNDEIGLGSANALLSFQDPDSTIQAASRLIYDESTMTFYLDKKPVELTLNQFRLLHHLYRHAGDVCTREVCAEVIWGRDYDPGLDADALDRVISKLRINLRKIDPDAELLQTRRGLGYILIL